MIVQGEEEKRGERMGPIAPEIPPRADYYWEEEVIGSDYTALFLPSFLETLALTATQWKVV